jgi:plastocyanin
MAVKWHFNFALRKRNVGWIKLPGPAGPAAAADRAGSAGKCVGTNPTASHPTRMNDVKSLFRYFPGVAAAALFCLGCPLSAVAASTNVVVGSPLDRFSPAVVTIAAGDQVIWTWAGTFHSTTSGTNGVAGDDNGVPSGLWNSGTITTLPHTFTNTFPVAGNFSYYCQVHYNFGMLGSVIVNPSGNIAPTVSITNPATGALFVVPANVTIQATVTNGSGTVTNVQFLVGSSVLTNEAAVPFSVVTNNLAAGSYTLTAIVSDNLGATATNSVNITVDTPPAVTITNPLNNATLSAPADVNLQVSASDQDAGGSVTNVQFLVGTTVLTNETAAPFFAGTNNLAAGSYTLSVVASDNYGVKNTNAVTINVVTPVQTALSGTTQTISTNFQFSYSANVGLSYIVQRSTNLAPASWVTLVTNVATSNPVVFVDNHTTNGPGFYRVGRLPNP